MTKAMPFLQKVILLSYDPRPFWDGVFISSEKAHGLFRREISWQSGLDFPGNDGIKKIPPPVGGGKEASGGGTP